ncbi:bifunctional 3-(3-hydroxy-phenyl)propionate/3-hydroxycinnamic acid hydroxylase [Corynebacterium sp. S7]
MSDTFDADVAIIGYGPSGVAAANALGSLGISTIAFERDESIYQRARAVTVNDWTMRTFQSVGLDDAAKADMDSVLGLQWLNYKGEKLMSIPFEEGQFGHDTHYGIYQPYLENTLREGAKRYHDKSSLHVNTEVIGLKQDSDGVSVTVRDLTNGSERTVRTRYALACDGGSSATREDLGIGLEGDTLSVRWVVIDAKVKRWWPNRHLLTFWSDEDRPVVDMALARDNHRWEIPLKEGEKDSDFDTSEKVWPLLESMGVSHDDVEIFGHAFYNHHLRSAERWRDGRVFLLGDAAHMMPPWAGSGMQSGIRDAFNIAWKLAAVINGKLDDEVLDTYQAEREPNVAFLTQVSAELGRVITQQLSDEEKLAMKEELESDAPKEPHPLLWPPTYPAGWFSGEIGDDSPVGKLIPQPRAANSRGEIGLLDDYLGQDFVVLGAGADPNEFVDADDLEQWRKLGARVHAVRRVDQSSESADDLIDIDGSLISWMEDLGVKVVAVRPDKFVAAAGTTRLPVPSFSKQESEPVSV